MSARNGILGLVAMSLALAWMPQSAEAQRRFLDRAKQAAREIITDEVMHHADDLVGDIATRVVDDGRFMAVATPWVAGDGSGVVNRSTISGHAVVVRSGGSFSILLCDDTQLQGWRAGFQVRNATAALRAAQTPADVEAQRQAAIEQREAMRSGAAEPAAAAPSPFIGSYPLATQFSSGAVTGPGARAEGAAEGSVRIESTADDLWVGTATITLPTVYLVGSSEARAVQVAAAFRARPHSASTPASCSPGVR